MKQIQEKKKKKRPQTTNQPGKILPHFKFHAYMHHVMLPIHSGCTPTFRSSSLLASETLVRRGKLAGQKPRYNNCRSSSLFLPLDLMSGSWSPVLPQESWQGSWALFTLFSVSSKELQNQKWRPWANRSLPDPGV